MPRKAFCPFLSAAILIFFTVASCSRFTPHAHVALLRLREPNQEAIEEAALRASGDPITPAADHARAMLLAHHIMPLLQA